MRKYASMNDLSIALRMIKKKIELPYRFYSRVNIKASVIMDHFEIACHNIEQLLLYNIYIYLFSQITCNKNE